VKIAVIGGAGFVGSALVRALLDPHEVTVIDNFSRGAVSNVPPDVRVIKTDAREIGSLDGFDFVYDFAARVYGVRDLYKDPAALLSDNIAITTAVLRSVAAAKVPYLYVSSSCVYDFPDAQVPHREDDVNICDTSYGFSKVAGEQLAKWYAKQYGFPLRIVRLFNVYGPGDSMQSPHVIPEFIKKAQACRYGMTNTFPILGSGDQTRDFTFMDDVVSGLLTIAARGEEGEAYNVGTGKAVSIQSLADMVCQQFGIAPEFIHEPVAAEDIQKRCADITKLRSLGWAPLVSLSEGIRRMADIAVPA
jgi:UDP-glucose 4-epimerase